MTVQTEDGTEETNYSFSGIENEVLAFGKACYTSQQSQEEAQQLFDIHYNTPDEAVKDLRFVEACLLSGKKNGELLQV